jgi:hypothetical protein
MQCMSLQVGTAFLCRLMAPNGNTAVVALCLLLRAERTQLRCG